MLEAFNYYEGRDSGAGHYFFDRFIEDLNKIADRPGTHPKREGFYYARSKRFHRGIYYTIERREIVVVAILDSRRNPEQIRRTLRQRRRYD